MSKLTIAGFVTATFFIALLSGCATSPDARFYILSSEVGAPLANWGEGSPTLLIAPVNVPVHVRRSEIIFQSHNNEVTVHDHDRWAERLDKNLSDVLSNNLSKLLSSKKVFTDDSNFSTRPEIILRIDINELGLKSDGQVVLDTSWEIENRKDNTITLYSENIELTPKSKSVSQVVATMSAAIGKLSEKISHNLISTL